MNAYKQLQSIIDNGIKNNPLPYRKGNSIRIGKIVIRESSTQGYIIFDSELSQKVAIAGSLRGAIAVAKKYMQNQDYQQAKFLDMRYVKYLNDSVFYKETVAKSKDPVRKFIAQDRLDIAEDEMLATSKSLEDIIFDNKR
jgi:hypothetical protein